MTQEPYLAISGKSRIPIRNVWLLLLYASDFYRSGPKEFDGIEEYPTELPDLLARILIPTVQDRLRRPLTPEFSGTVDDLRRVRGRIDVLRTASHQLLLRGQVACRFEELTVDTPGNRTVLAALTLLTGLVSSTELGRNCREQVNALLARGVRRLPTASDPSAGQRRTRNNARDQRMLLAARLALQLALPADDGAKHGHERQDMSIEEFRRLFERAVGGFYSSNLPTDWSVRAGRELSWNGIDATPGFMSLLPRMKTDILLQNAAANRRVIIDTKFTDILKLGRHNKKLTLKSGHLYQLYTYVRSQEVQGDPLSFTTEGLLLYPSTGVAIRESFCLSGHRFTAATVDLNVPAAVVRAQLLDLID